jgi:hypothetical protein
MAKIRLLGQPHGTWVSLEILKLPQGTWISYEAPGSASRFLDQLWNTWVSHSRPKNLETDPVASWLEHEYLGQPQRVSLKVLGSAMEHLGQPQGF